MLAAPTTYNNNLLPPKLAGSKQARHHKFMKEWLKAEGKEYLSHNENGTWDIVVYLPKGFFALSTTWVYKYKLNDAGKLVCFKARLVDCGHARMVTSGVKLTLPSLALLLSRSYSLL
jgi:hypothetical protein